MSEASERGSVIPRSHERSATGTAAIDPDRVPEPPSKESFERLRITALGGNPVEVDLVSSGRRDETEQAASVATQIKGGNVVRTSWLQTPSNCADGQRAEETADKQSIASVADRTGGADMTGPDGNEAVDSGQDTSPAPSEGDDETPGGWKSCFGCV